MNGKLVRLIMVILICVSAPVVIWADSAELVAARDTLRKLDEVVVVKSLTEREGNRESYTVTKKMRDNSHNAGELLRGLGGIYYDPLSTEVKYLGSKKIVILVDSVEKSADYIKRMNPKRFDRIDVISFPDGKYAEYDAVINYHTKPLYVGYEGVVKGEVNMLPTGATGKGKEVYNSNDALDLTYTKEKVNLSLTGNYHLSQNGLSRYQRTEYPYNQLIETTAERPRKEPGTEFLTNMGDVSLAMDYQVNKRHSVSVMYQIMPGRSTTDERMEYETETDDIGPERWGMESHQETKNVSHKIGAFYRGQLKNDWSLNGTMSYNFTGGDFDYSYDRSTGYETSYSRHNNSKYLWGGFDVMKRSRNRKWSLGLSEYVTGVSYRQRNRNGDQEENETDEFRNRVSLNVSHYPTRKFSLGGYVGMHSVHRSNCRGGKTYLSPRGRLWGSWLIGRGNGVRVNYTVKQVSPMLNQIQDYGYYRNPLIYLSGNPELKPSIKHKITVTGFINNGLNLKFDYELTKSEIFTMKELAEGDNGENYVRETYRNGDGRALRLNLTYFRNLSKSIAVSADGGIERNSARLGCMSKHRYAPNLNWFVSYNNQVHSVMVYVSGSLYNHTFVSPQEMTWGATDGFALSVMKTNKLKSGSLVLVAMWHLPVHLVSGDRKGVIDSEAYRATIWENNQFRTDNLIQLTAVWSLSGGEKTRKYNRSIESVE